MRITSAAADAPVRPGGFAQGSIGRPAGVTKHQRRLVPLFLTAFAWASHGKTRAQARRKSLAEKPEFELGETITNFFRRAGPEAEPFGHHRQAAAQFRVALLEMIANFAALKRRDHGIGNPPPRDRLPVPQLSYFAA